MRVFITGMNGFIGHSLTQRILQETDWEVSGIDLDHQRLRSWVSHPRLDFLQGSIVEERKWVDDRIARADVVLPLVAIAQPKLYVDAPIRVFQLVFEENLRIIRQCLQHQKRVVFPSTSEVYGMCADAEFNEETSPMIFGPISKQRWIYACAKQMLDRVIWAYGKEGLRFTIFRPFNWFGPNLDRIENENPGGSRVVTQFLGNLLRGQPLQLVDGGSQRRTFTYITDGIDALMRILKNRDGAADGAIFNIGNPANECSIADLARLMIQELAQHPGFEHLDTVQPEMVASEAYYGSGYQDVQHRKPDVTALRKALGWEARVGLKKGLALTIAFYLKQREVAESPATAILGRVTA